MASKAAACADDGIGERQAKQHGRQRDDKAEAAAYSRSRRSGPGLRKSRPGPAPFRRRLLRSRNAASSWRTAPRSEAQSLRPQARGPANHRGQKPIEHGDGKERPAPGAEREALRAPALAGDGDEGLAAGDERSRITGAWRKRRSAAAQARSRARSGRFRSCRTGGSKASACAPEARASAGAAKLATAPAKVSEAAAISAGRHDRQDDAEEDARTARPGHLARFDEIGADRTQRRGDDGVGQREIVGDKHDQRRHQPPGEPVGNVKAIGLEKAW